MQMPVGSLKQTEKISISKEEVLRDYREGWTSRHISYLGRKEVFLGRAKFGVFGDGKELPQVVMAKVFRKGDFRSGYYRDQTFMFATGMLTYQQFYAQLYAHTDVKAEPASAGRLMNGHFATRMLDESGNWLPLTGMKNSSADVSPTAAQMPRLVGLAWASKLYRNSPELSGLKDFSINGNEVAYGTIGNAATSEGIFFESINAAAVLQIPMVTSIWDDGYGISVSNKFHTPKEDISKALEGFRRSEQERGIELFQVKGWDYKKLIEVYSAAERIARKEHVPVVIHVTELTQPLGHSTSGSHERYKSKERLEWEKEFDCLVKFREWILGEELATREELEQIEREAEDRAKEAKEAAWKAYIEGIIRDRDKVVGLISDLGEQPGVDPEIRKINLQLAAIQNPLKQDILKAIRKVLILTRDQNMPAKDKILQWMIEKNERIQKQYSSHLHSQSKDAALLVKEVKPAYTEQSKVVDGREVLQACFDAALTRDPRVVAFGEDVGKIGDVNQAFAGLQEKHGEHRVMDTSIRETTIVGQAIGLAMRGLRPIAEIQYVDYLIYAIQTLSDDLSCLYYRTRGGQKAPAIIRTRGHRLEGVWHSGSPMGMILNSIRGMYVLVPRNMTQAAGLYNTMLRSDDPALIIETLNGYRLKERLPENIMEFTIPLGVPEVIREGSDVTLVTYGALCRIALEAAGQLEQVGISLEVIDVRTLLPFDLKHMILESVKKTNRIIFADEDVPGGASAFMMQRVLEEQDAFRYLDSRPMTLSSKEHRPAYGSDGDYISKVNAEDIFITAYNMMREFDPERFPPIYPSPQSLL